MSGVEALEHLASGNTLMNNWDIRSANIPASSPALISLVSLVILLTKSCLSAEFFSLFTRAALGSPICKVSPQATIPKSAPSMGKTGIEFV